MMLVDSNEYTPYLKSAGIAAGIAAVLTGLVVIHYFQISGRPGTIVIPAGNTYLGPNSPNTLNPPTSPTTPTVFTAASDTPWHEVKGKLYPYVMIVPTTLNLLYPGNNPYDIYEISWNNLDPGSMVLVGVDNLKDTPSREGYITQPKMNYVREWWHQFGGLKGVASIDPFTNSHNLKGYKAKYFNAAGETPAVDIFFEVPDQPQYVIHMANGVLDPAIFDKIIDSVNWEQ